MAAAVAGGSLQELMSLAAAPIHRLTVEQVEALDTAGLLEDAAGAR